MSQPRAGGWEPANEVERRMRHAWQRQDHELLLRTLATAQLYLPGFADDGREGTGGTQRLLTRRRGDHTYLLVFTSPAALYEAVGGAADGWRPTTMAELARAWPDPSWGLAVSPTTPIGAYLDPEQMAAVREATADEPVFHPADSREAQMFQAKRTGDPGIYLDLLVSADVLVPVGWPVDPRQIGAPGFPWRMETVDGLPTVSVFTSPARLADAIAEPVPTVQVSMLQVIRAWPDAAWRMAVNPGTAIDAAFPGGNVPDLVRWAQGLAIRMEERTGPSQPGSAPAVEVVLKPPDVRLYLDGGHDLVSGEVHRATEAPVPAGGYVVRWFPEPDRGAPPAPGQTVRDLPVPSGARLYQRLGTDRLVATYQGHLHRWAPVEQDRPGFAG